MLSNWKDRTGVAGGIALALIVGLAPASLGQQADPEKAVQGQFSSGLDENGQVHYYKGRVTVGFDENGQVRYYTDQPQPNGHPLFGRTGQMGPPGVVNFTRDGMFAMPVEPLGLGVIAADEALRSHLGLEEKTGLVVTEVRPKGAGAEAGLKAHDILLSVGDTPLREPADLAKTIVDGGKKLSVRIVRGGKRKTIEVTPEARFKAVRDFPRAEGEGQPSTAPEYWIGISVASVQPTLRAQLGLEDKVGLLASSVVEDSPAAKAGVKANDIVESVGGKSVSDNQSLIASVQEAKGQPVPMKLIRAGKPLTVEVKPEKRPANKFIARPGSGAEELYRSLNLRPGVVIPNQGPGAAGPHPGGNLAEIYGAYNQALAGRQALRASGARQAEIDAKLDALAEQLKGLQKSVDELKQGRKER